MLLKAFSFERKAMKSQAHLCTWRIKALSVPFLIFKAGSEILPVRSGAAKLDALKAFSVERKEMKKPGIIFACGALKLFLFLFLFLKLEVIFFQCVAVRPISMHLGLS
jgi:hypothetical protein